MLKPDDSVVLSDVRSFLDSCNNVIIMNNKRIIIPEILKLDIVSSLSLEYRFQNISIGNHSRFVVALGGVGTIEHGIPSTSHGFIQIWYTSDGSLFSHDYLEHYPH